jgi:pilus assembly protein Flp/PilA
MLAQLKKFLQEDHGAQVVEYALIIAVISIALVLALQPVFVSGQIATFIGRLTTCLTTAVCI